MNDLHQQVGWLLRLVALAGGPLERRNGLWVGPFRPAGRRHTRPWAVGADIAELCLVVMADDGEAGRFPLDGSTLGEARVVLAETVSTHVGVELELIELPNDFRFGGLAMADLAAFDSRLDALAVARWIEGD